MGLPLQGLFVALEWEPLAGGVRVRTSREDYEQVSIASACSGHGFKFASVIGEILADLSTTGVARHDIILFRLERLLPHRRGYRAGREVWHPGEQDNQPRSFPG